MSYKWVWPGEFHVVARWARWSLQNVCSVVVQEKSVLRWMSVRPYFTAVTAFSLHFWTRFTFLKECPLGTPLLPSVFFLSLLFFLPSGFPSNSLPFFRVASTTYLSSAISLNQRDKKINKSANYCFQGVFIFASLPQFRVTFASHLSSNRASNYWNFCNFLLLNQKWLKLFPLDYIRNISYLRAKDVNGIRLSLTDRFSYFHHPGLRLPLKNVSTLKNCVL